jgi:hypothetical protein
MRTSKFCCRAVVTSAVSAGSSKSADQRTSASDSGAALAGAPRNVSGTATSGRW